MKKKFIAIVVIIIALILLFPIPMRLKDGGSVEYRALLYTITKYHRLSANPNQMYIDGWGIEILGMEIYNGIKEQENEGINEIKQNALKSRVDISYDKITNIHLLDNFLDNTDKYNNNTISSKVEISTYTIEGDEILTILEYDKETDEFKITRDNTKDKFANIESRKIETNVYPNSTYNLVKQIKDNYIYLILEVDDTVDSELEDITILAYDKNLEKNKDTSRTKLNEVSLKAEETDTKELVVYNGILYGRSYGMIDYAGNPNGPIGTINKLVGEEYVPTLDGETNTEKLLNAKVDGANERSLVLLINNEAVLYWAIEETTYSFYATVIQSNAKNIIVEPEEDSQERKSSDKISIGLGANGDMVYEVGTKLKITYNGMIMETYPAKINAIKIEVKSADEFELIFNARKDLGIKTVISKEETDKYSYNIYTYGGDVKIRIDGTEYDLKDALLNNKITMEEIIAKANKDLKNKKITGDKAFDGGSAEYYYEDYTILKCHTIDGNRDVYIGVPYMRMKDVL